MDRSATLLCLEDARDICMYNAWATRLGRHPGSLHGGASQKDMTVPSMWPEGSGRQGRISQPGGATVKVVTSHHDGANARRVDHRRGILTSWTPRRITSS